MAENLEKILVQEDESWAGLGVLQLDDGKLDLFWILNKIS